MRAQGSAYEILRNVLESAKTPLPPGSQVPTYRGTAQSASTGNGPYEVQLSDGGIVYVSRKDAGITWSLGDEVLLIRAGWSWCVTSNLSV